MKKLCLLVVAILSSVASAGTLTIMGKDNKVLDSSVKIERVHQIQYGGTVVITARSQDRITTCEVSPKSQTEINSLISAIASGANVLCSDAKEAASGGYTAGSYSLFLFLGN